MPWTKKLENVITFHVDMEPVGKGRPRFTRSGRVYTPPKTAKAEKAIRDAYICAVGIPQPWGDEVEVQIVYHRQLAKSSAKCMDYCADLGKPDADNVAKLVMDALNECAWTDDANVTVLDVRKERRMKTKASYIDVTIRLYANWQDGR